MLHTVTFLKTGENIISELTFHKAYSFIKFIVKIIQSVAFQEEAWA